MPKKKPKPRKPARRGRRGPGPQLHSDEEFTLVHSPARTLLRYPAGEDAEIETILGTWPYQMAVADDTGGTTCLVDVAGQAGTSVRDAAESLVRLEDENFLLWVPNGNRYLLLTPDGTQDPAH